MTQQKNSGGSFTCVHPKTKGRNKMCKLLLEKENNKAVKIALYFIQYFNQTS